MNKGDTITKEYYHKWDIIINKGVIITNNESLSQIKWALSQIKELL